MIPSTLNTQLEENYEIVPVKTHQGIHLAATSLDVIGSVHASGEAYLSIDNLYGDITKYPHFKMYGSIHKMGNEELKIGKQHPQTEITNTNLSAKNFTDSLTERKYEIQDTNLTINSIVLYGDEKPELTHALDRAGYDCYNELEFYGDVHSSGKMTLSVEHVFIV